MQQPQENFKNPIGIYRHPVNKAEIGCTDPAQADAVVQAGFRLVKDFENVADVIEAAKEKKAEAVAPVAPQGVK